MGAPKGNKYALGNKGGAPLTYETPEEMEKIIDGYFESCWEEHWERTGKVNEQGKDIWKPVYDKDGNIQFRLRERPTVTGLALALGFTTRHTLMNYQVKNEFMHTIKKAKMLIEHYYEKGVVEG
ncbi:MAG: terminase small subunit, partial [Promethearchaeota archaeon]